MALKSTWVLVLAFLSCWSALGVVRQPEWGRVGESGRYLMSSASQHRHHQRQKATVEEPAAGFQVWLPRWWTPDQIHWSLMALDRETSALPVYHSQDGEDEYAYNQFFINQRSGVYLEIGGNDGLLFSNTLFFREYLGWRGVLIEASPLSYSRLIQNRKDDICVHAAACDVSREVHFIGADLPPDVTLETMVSGIVEFMPEEFLETFYKDANLDAAVKIPCLPLSHILSKVGLKHIDFMSLDVEGAELAVLKTFDFEAVRVSVMVIETDGHDKTKDHQVREIMFENGYELLEGTDRAFTRNSWFVHQLFHALPPASVERVT